jgi:guanine deaminase
LSETYGCYIQTHLSENVEEVALVRLLFPDSKNYTEVYRDHGLLHGKTLLAHCIHLDRGECHQIREAGATVVHCPTSNTFLRSGAMPLRRWLEEGLSVGLGTDVGAGTSLSLWAEGAMACHVSKLRWSLLQGGGDPVSPEEAFHLATAGGAAALGLEGCAGTLAPGNRADFLVVDPRVPDPAGRTQDAPERILSRLLYRAEPTMIRATFVGGRLCHGTLPAV